MADVNKKYLTKSEMPWEQGPDYSGGAQMLNTVASGSKSLAGGPNNSTSIAASGQGAIAFGDNEAGSIVASGPGSQAMGYCDQADQDIGIEASCEGAHAEGCVDGGGGIFASGSGSHAEGCAESSGGINAGGKGAHAEGYSAYDGFSINAYGNGSHAEGYNEGGGIMATGKGAHAEGYNDDQDNESSNSADGDGSHVEGHCTVATNTAEHAEGHFNLSNQRTTGTDAQKKAGSTLHSVGIGTSQVDRKNAFEIMQNGDMYVLGFGGYDGTNVGASGLRSFADFLSLNIPFNVISYMSSQNDIDYYVTTYGNTLNYKYQPFLTIKKNNTIHLFHNVDINTFLNNSEYFGRLQYFFEHGGIDLSLEFDGDYGYIEGVYAEGYCSQLYSDYSHVIEFGNILIILGCYLQEEYYDFPLLLTL